MKNFRLALVVLITLSGGHTLGAGTFAMPQTAPKAELESASQAKRALVSMESRNYARIKDASLREAARRSLNAVKALANNTARAKEATLIASFNHALDNLKAKGKAVGVNENDCADKVDRCGKISSSQLQCDLLYTDCLLQAYFDLNKPGYNP